MEKEARGSFFFECSLFRVVVAISPEGGGNLLRGYMTCPPRIS